MEHTGPSSHAAAEETAATDALGRSHLGKLPRQTLERILEAATHVTVPAGSLLHREGDTAAHLQVVVDGLLRVFVTALDGRTLTVRYCRAGSILGAVSLFASPFSMPASVQAVTDAHIVSMPAQSVRDSADRDVVVARAIIDELSERVMSFISEIPGSAFATVKQRIARHLLDLATSNQTGPELTARISQQELAEAVGTVREVVVRSLRDLREDGSVDTGRDGIVILDPQGLSETAYRGHGTHVPWP